MRRAWLVALIMTWVGLVAPAPAPALAAEPELRVGELRFGTVSWQLDVIAHHGLDRDQGFRLAEVEMASTPATLVALQAGAVDAVVSDWLWVSRQRAAGAPWTFLPFSTAVGALVVPAESPIHGLADLRQRRLGVAGTALDKSWLLLRLLARQRFGFDLEHEAVPSFGAPPLLDQELLAGRLDAVLTYWPFAAKLEARGLRRVMSVDEVLRALGITTALPMVGYVVSESWAAQHPLLVQGFVQAVRRADEILAGSDAEWERLSPRTGARDAAELHRLRDAFRAGIPQHWGEAERGDAARLYGLLAAIGGSALVGDSPALQPGTFLDTVRY